MRHTRTMNKATAVQSLTTFVAFLLVIASTINSTTAQQTTGFGCYNIPTLGNACSCTDLVCTEESCTAAKGIWTDQCSSCQCDSGGGAFVQSNPDEGFGCYDSSINQCDCSDEACSEESCAAKNVGLPEQVHVWTDGCMSCQCGSVSSSGSNESSSAGNGNSVESDGCYDSSENVCDCSPGACSQESCEAKNAGLDTPVHFWTNGCRTCACEGTGPGASSNSSASEETGLGCYYPGSMACECRPDVCTSESCKATGGIFTDQCTSCKCDSSTGEDAGSPPVGERGTGCFSTAEDLCDCSDEVCSEDRCTAQGDGYVWTDQCLSCHCFDDAFNIDHNGDKGYGCFDTDLDLCDCSDELCNEAVCQSKGPNHVWTDSCLSCQCESISNESDEGFGCYDVGTHQCDCSPVVCAEKLCSAAGGLFTSQCSSCQCDHSGNISAGEEQVQATENVGWGCYDVTEHECECTASSCSKEGCEALNIGLVEPQFFWGDSCKSCQCTNVNEDGIVVAVEQTTNSTNANLSGGALAGIIIVPLALVAIASLVLSKKFMIVKSAPQGGSKHDPAGSDGTGEDPTDNPICIERIDSSSSNV